MTLEELLLSHVRACSVCSLGSCEVEAKTHHPDVTLENVEALTHKALVTLWGRREVDLVWEDGDLVLVGLPGQLD